MNQDFVKVKQYFNKKQASKDKDSGSLKLDLEIEEKRKLVQEHITYLLSCMNDELEDDDSQIHTLKCLSKFIHHKRVKNFLFKHFHSTKFESLKKEIRKLYKGNLDTSELDETMDYIKELRETEAQAAKEIEDEFNDSN